MKSIFKLFIGSLLSLTLSVATVTCCCSAAAARAQFHKAAVTCSHCMSAKPQGLPNKPKAGCDQQLTNAEFSVSQITSSVPTAVLIPSFIDKQAPIFVPSTVRSYPRGSPPREVNFIPLYLHTFNLRI